MPRLTSRTRLLLVWAGVELIMLVLGHAHIGPAFLDGWQHGMRLGCSITPDAPACQSLSPEINLGEGT